MPSDTSIVSLDAAAKVTGIENRIARRRDSAGKGGRYFPDYSYFALVPAWVGDKKRQDTSHGVYFWLNPMHQDRYNSGWFTVEELDEWLEGRGPVMKHAST